MYEFDLKTFLKQIYSKRKILFINCAIAFVLSLIVSFSIPKTYTSSACLVPELPDEDAIGGNLGSLASAAGFNLGNINDAIGPDLYPDVLHSNSFVIDLLYSDVLTVDGEEMDYLTFLKTKARHPWWSVITRSFGKLMKKLNPQPVFTKSSNGNERINPERMSREEANIVEGVKGSIGCKMNDQTLIIDLHATAQDPFIAKTLVDTIMLKLQNFIIDYRTNKARVDLEYYKGLEEKAFKAYIRASNLYAQYCDSHKGTILQAYLSEQERLENDLSMALETYTQVRQHVSSAEAKLREKTPAFTIIEKASVPNLHSAPKKMMIAIAFLFVAFIGTVFYYYFKLLYSKKE